MIHRDSSDLPPYDVVEFEEQRQARAKQFAETVKSLTRFNMIDRKADSEGGFVMRGANYVFPDGREVAVMRQGYFKTPESSTSAVRVSSAWSEHLGIDGLRRRVRRYRHMELEVSSDIDWSNLVDDDLPEPLPPEPDHVQKALKRLQELQEQTAFEISMDPSYRPAELIEARSGSIVEVKLKQGPNWRTEYEATLNSQDAKLANLAAQRQAGVEMEPREYSEEEHESLMFVLQVIKLKGMEPAHLPYDIL